MLDFVLGTRLKPGIDDLVAELRGLDLPEGTLYTGYPVLSTADETVTLDALLTTPTLGVVAIDLPDAGSPSALGESLADQIEDRQTRLVLGLKAKLLRHKGLTARTDLAIPVSAVTYLPATTAIPDPRPPCIAIAGRLSEALSDLPAMDRRYYKALNAAIQHVSTIKPRNRRANVMRPNSRGAVMRSVEREIANLDRWQKMAAIETPDGPQRVRGLAGSGKTVVLALKAAYLHAQHPDWRIAVTFQTRSLYAQFQDFIRRFSFEHTSDEPNWEQLRILHAWGSAADPGVYSLIAGSYGQPARDFSYAVGTYGRAEAFAGVCQELLDATDELPAQELFDAVLIDEAQDLPSSFFRVVYRALSARKRVVWAYDELQNLHGVSLPPVSDLFGRDASGVPLVTLQNVPGQAHQDVTLRRCYRNTPWALVTAHALGLGVYREKGLIQAFDDPGLWTDIGYRVVSGELAPGQEVLLERDGSSSPDFFEHLLTKEDAVVFQTASSDLEQVETVAREVARNLQEDELEATDIIVIFPNPLTWQQQAGPLVAALRRLGIESHMAGVTRSRNEFLATGSVAISGIFRAKGNEAPMVYLLDSQFCLEEPETIRKRNTLFTAITRSRGWVRVFGVGAGMDRVRAEYERVVDNQYRLRMKLPLADELARIRRIHRDRTREEKQRANEFSLSLLNIAEAIEAGEVAAEDLSPDARERLRDVLG